MNPCEKAVIPTAPLHLTFPPIQWELKTRQQEKELEELSEYNDLLRKKVKEGDLDIKRLNKANAKTRVWKRKVKSQSELIESLKGDVEFLEETLRRGTSESKKYRRLTEKRLAFIAKEREVKIFFLQT